MDEILKLQGQWLYLQPIFSSADIVDQMYEEARLFDTVNNYWKQASDFHVIYLGYYSRSLSMVRKIMEHLKDLHYHPG